MTSKNILIDLDFYQETLISAFNVAVTNLSMGQKQRECIESEIEYKLDEALDLVDECFSNSPHDSACIRIIVTTFSSIDYDKAQ